VPTTPFSPGGGTTAHSVLTSDNKTGVVFAGVAALPCVRLATQLLLWFGCFTAPVHALLDSVHLFSTSFSLLDVSALAALLAFWHAREVRTLSQCIVRSAPQHRRAS
jgi:hypothetical protein